MKTEHLVMNFHLGLFVSKDAAIAADLNSVGKARKLLMMPQLCPSILMDNPQLSYKFKS